MKNTGCFRDIQISPLTGVMDLRSANGAVGLQNWRVILNVGVRDSDHPVRLGGWRRLFANSSSGFLNQDLHDQLLCLSTYYESYSVTLIGGGALTGNQYLYFWPESSSGATQTTGHGSQCGYVYDLNSPDQVYSFNSGISAGLWAYNVRVGFPYSIISPDYLACNTGAPDYYGGSYFYFASNEFVTTLTPGYPYGPSVPVYSNPFEYDYNYCGDTLYTRQGCRGPVTMLFEFETETGRRLIASTETTIYELNEAIGNWRVIADGLGSPDEDDLAPCAESSRCGCGGRRFSAVSMGNYVLFTNFFDAVLAYRQGAQASGCDLMSAVAIPELTALGIRRAKTIASWKGFIFLGGITDDSSEKPYRIMWSDFNAPLQWDSAVDGSQAGFQDLALSERVISMQPLGDYFYIFTEEAIYQVVQVSIDEGLFRFREIYRGPDVPKFRYAIVNTGEALIYMGEDTIYQFTLYDPRPQVINWIDRAAGAIYNGLSSDHLGGFAYLSSFSSINRSMCDEAVGFYDENEKAVWFSWPTGNNNCPTMSLRLDLRHSFASIVDHGFTAGGMFRSDNRPTVASFFRDWQVCQPSSWAGTVKEGDPYPVTEAAFSDPPPYLFNEAEDPNATLHPQSLCARWGDLRIQDLCDVCDSTPILILASAVDYCLKQWDQALKYREEYDSTGACTGAASSHTTIDGSVYCVLGYSSLYQSDMNKIGVDEEKIINKVVIDYEAEEQTTPNLISCDIAYSSQPRCSTWNNIGSKELRCLTEATAAQHAANNTRPDLFARFPCFQRGRYLGWRFYVEAADGESTVTGGGTSFNGVTLSVRKAQGEW